MLIDYVKQNYLNPPSKKVRQFSAAFNSYFTEMRLLSWNAILSYVQKYFTNTTHGFFVEAGALDGEILSNTMWLEVYRNWTGLLVEPNKSSYSAMLQKNRNVWTSNACVSTVPYPKETLLVGTVNEHVSSHSK